MATAVEAARAEITAALQVLAPQLEGFRDFARLNIAAPTKVAVDALIAEYDRRSKLLTAAGVALDAVVADGYPEIPVHAVEQEIYEELRSNAETVLAALAKVEPRLATKLGLEADDPVAK